MNIEIKQVADMVQDYFLELKKSSIKKNSIPYFTDDLGEIRQGEIHIIAGVAGIGKTGLMLTQAMDTAVKQNKGVLFFSFDVSSTTLLRRIISIITNAPIHQFSNQDDFSLNVKKSLDQLEKIKLYISENECLNIMELKNTIIEFVKSQDIKLIVLDSLEQIPNFNQNNSREKEILEIIKIFKEIAIELNIAFMISTQISHNDWVVPSLACIDYRSILERFADKILLINRPEYYAINDFEDGSDSASKAEIIIAYNKLGATNKIRLNYNHGLISFSE